MNGGSGGRRRQSTDSGSVTFPASVSSGVVSGLLGGQYQFSVSVTLSVNGQTFNSTPGVATTGTCVCVRVCVCVCVCVCAWVSATLAF